MKTESNRASIEALKNMLSEVDLILSTADPLPENRTARCRELLSASLALADDLRNQGRDKAAVILGHKGGTATSQRHGIAHYRMMAASRKVHGGGRPKTHGYSRTPEYVAWCDMKARCYNENNRFYSEYGARGVRVDPSWLDKENGFSNFIDCMGPRPNDFYSVDRIDNNGNYEPGNVRWALKDTQMRNRRPYKKRHNPSTQSEQNNF